MPELPEVEFARRWLQRWMAGATVTHVHVQDARILDDGTSAGAVTRALRGRRVEKVERRGKWLRIALDRGALFSHLGMTGKWVRADDEEPVRFEKVRLDVRKGKTARSIRYTDPRLFGRFVVAKSDIDEWTELGPDPLHDGVDPARLGEALSRRAVSVKAAVMDQKVLAGVGNIQATEALFFARIDPRRPAKTLSAREVKALARGVERSIDETMKLQEQFGEKLDYVEEPGAENPFKIYGHAGEPCPRCKTQKLAKIVLAGRGTVFCPRCQN